MTLLQKIKADQLLARKTKDVSVSLLTTLLGEATSIGKNSGNRETTDDEVFSIIKKFIKCLDEMIEFSKDVNLDIYTSSLLERDILLQYLPKQLSSDELRSYIEAISNELGLTKKSDMGQLMATIKTRLMGNYDGKEASIFVKGILQ